MSKDFENLLANSQPAGLIATPTTPAVVNRGIQTTGGSVGQAASDTVGFETLTVSSSPVSLTPVGNPTRALISVADDDIRFRADGTAPTLTIGHLVLKDGVIELESAADIASFEAIRTTLDAILSISYLV